jgi:hypothetical protein
MTTQWTGDRRKRDRDTGWLDVLIEAFEEAEMLHGLPCDENIFAIVKERLEQPSVLRARELLSDYKKEDWLPKPSLPCNL